MSTLSSEQEGSRKVILTKWMLIIFSFGTLGYFILLGLRGKAPPDSFFMNFVLGLSAIGGSFTVGNIFEHRAKAEEKIAESHSEAEKEKAKEETIRALEQTKKAQIEKEKIQEETKKAQVEKEKAQEETKKAQIENEKG